MIILSGRMHIALAMAGSDDLLQGPTGPGAPEAGEVESAPIAGSTTGRACSA
jgi:hypothetical protein